MNHDHSHDNSGYDLPVKCDRDVYRRRRKDFFVYPRHWRSWYITVVKGTLISVCILCFPRFVSHPLPAVHSTRCSEIGSLTSLDAPELCASSDVREPISLSQGVLGGKVVFTVLEYFLEDRFILSAILYNMARFHHLIVLNLVLFERWVNKLFKNVWVVRQNTKDIWVEKQFVTSCDFFSYRNWPVKG